MTRRSPSLGAPSRSSFALTGPSVALDPRTHAVRRDLADVRLADRVFAPHYAEPLNVEIRAAVDLTSSPGPEGDRLATLKPGDIFELLERSGDHGWGIAANGLVGYVDEAALALDPA